MQSGELYNVGESKQGVEWEIGFCEGDYNVIGGDGVVVVIPEDRGEDLVEVMHEHHVVNVGD
jgi:hypothetical protein